MVGSKFQKNEEYVPMGRFQVPSETFTELGTVHP